jgi:cation diffusion facilitator family transporter
MGESKVVVFGALAANVAIAAVKFAAALLTGSSAMLSEGVHSTIDAGNDVLLLVGMRLSRRAATPEHPFGHGKEVFFWGLIVAVLIFGVGGGVSAFEGARRVLRPEAIADPFWAYVVLGAAAVFEGASLFIGLRNFLRQIGDRRFFEALHTSKDPASYTVIVEDSAALLGILIAAIGVGISYRFNLPRVDGIASILIGLLLASVAVFLIAEARGLLIGEGLRPEGARDIRRLVLSHPRVRGVGSPLSMYIGPDEVLLTLDVEFGHELTTDEIAEAAREIRSNIQRRYSKITRIYVEACEPADSGAGRARRGATERKEAVVPGR